MSHSFCIDRESDRAISSICWRDAWKNPVHQKSAFVEVCGIFRISADETSSMEVERWFWTRVDGSELRRDIEAEIVFMNKRYTSVAFVKMLPK